MPDDVHVIRDFSKQRAEALTDGIFATVMTILVLTLTVPIILNGNVDQILSEDLIGLLPNILTYVMSFLVLGTLWIGHHNIFRYIESAGRRMQWINLVFLLSIGFIPFTTAILGKYPLEQPALLAYGINLLIIAIIYNAFWAYAIMLKLVHKEVDKQFVKKSFKRNFIGVFVYALGIIAAFFNPWISLGLYVFMPLFYISSAIFLYK
ncbi:MAG: DUF1211 domain-containing protein [Candidatus Micrarchaeota archaeon]|nr:DUF1211 domain-containing protein [Candidatus Micrarchaeota archaeon]